MGGFQVFLACGYPLRRGGQGTPGWQPSLGIKKKLIYDSMGLHQFFEVKSRPHPNRFFMFSMRLMVYSKTILLIVMQFIPKYSQMLSSLFFNSIWKQFLRSFFHFERLEKLRQVGMGGGGFPPSQTIYNYFDFYMSGVPKDIYYYSLQNSFFFRWS